jgi:hypothetical protein
MALDEAELDLLNIIAEDSSIFENRPLDTFEHIYLLKLVKRDWIQFSMFSNEDSIRDIVITDEGRAALAAYKLEHMK